MKSAPANAPKRNISTKSQASLRCWDLGVFRINQINYMKLLTALLFSSLPVLTVGAQKVCLNENFEKGISKFTLINEDGMPVQAGDFKKISPQKTWFVADGVNGNYSQVALSCSHRNYDYPTDNWMITPQLDITSADMWLTWKAQSVHHDMPESYEVLVGTDKDDLDSYEKIFSTDAENYFWQDHMVSLSKYKGQKVYVAFRHTSNQKYLLAVDDVFVGELATTSLKGIDQTARFAGLNAAGRVGVEGQAWNVGAPIKINEFRCTLADGSVQTLVPNKAELATGDSLAWHFDVPAELNKTSVYNVTAVDDKGNTYALASDSVFCSNYPRTMVVEKFTGLWCNSCPAMDPVLYAMEHRYGNQMIEIVAYGGSTTMPEANLLYDDCYLNNVHVVNYPTVYYNHIYSSAQTDTRDTNTFANAAAKSCYALATLQSATIADSTISGTASCEFAYDFDNSANRYRWGFALVEKKVECPIRQTNNCTVQQNNEYYYLPQNVPGTLHFCKSIARGFSDETTKATFKGLKESIPSTIEAGKSYTYNFSLALPSGVSNADASNLKLVAYVLNNFTGEIINAAVMDVAKGNSDGIAQAEGAATVSAPCIGFSSAYCSVAYPDGKPGVATVYSVDGKALLRSSASSFSISHLPAGTYIVRAVSATGATTVSKVVK